LDCLGLFVGAKLYDMLFFDTFIGFGDLEKYQRQDPQQQQKQPSEARLINKELNCERLNKDMVIIGTFSWMSRIFKASYSRL
jgi:hypothetical protein